MKRSIVVAVLLLAGPVLGQPEPEGDSPGAIFGERTEVRVVNVEVFVTREGDPVPGLTREDFQVLEDGETVELRYFSEVGSPRESEGDLVSGRPATDEDFSQAPGRFVVYVDSLFLRPARQDRLFSDLIETLEGALGPRDEVMVVTFDGSLKIRSPFTTEWRETRRALGEAASLEGIRIAAGLEELRDFETIRQFQGQGEEGACLHVGAVAQQHSQRMEQRVVASAKALEALVNSLGGMPGRKAILHVSDGIPLIAGGAVWRYALELCGGSGAIKGVPGSMDARVEDAPLSDKWNAAHYRTEMYSYDTSEHWRRLTAHANANNVALYPLQASGLGSVGIPGDIQTSLETDRFARFNLQDSLVVMGEETGGRVILNTNDFRAPISDVVSDSRHYYLLGFEPGGWEPSTRHEIRVKVDRPGLRVRHRKSYWAKSAEEELVDSVLTTLLHSWGDNPLHADLSVEQKRHGGGKVRNRATIRLRVPFEHLTLLPRESFRQGMLTVVLATRDLDGELSPIRQASIPLKVPADPEKDDFLYEIDLPIERDGKEVAVAIRDDFAGVTSFLREAIRLDLP